MLKLAGEGIRQEKIEVITYTPGIQNSGDLEAATHTIVPTSRPAIASAQYSKSLTLPAPSDARLAILRLCARLAVTIDNLGTATHVYCSVRVDVDDLDHELFNMDWTTIGAKLSAVDVHSASKAIIFNLLKDGAAHTFYFLFWADVASQAVISLVQLWEGVGSNNTNNGLAIFSINLTHNGFVGVGGSHTRVGTGTAYFELRNSNIANADWSRLTLLIGGDDMYNRPQLFLSPGALYFMNWGTVATDLNYISGVNIILRSEQ